MNYRKLTLILLPLLLSFMLAFPGMAVAQTGGTEYVLGADAIRVLIKSRQNQIKKYGFNSNVGASTEYVWTPGGTYGGFLQADSTIRVAAGGNANDDVGGSGCQEVTVQGLDDEWEFQTVALATNGASASTPTTETWWRVFRAWCSQVGTYGGTPERNVTLETTGGTTMAVVDSLFGQTQMLIYTVPKNHVLVVTTLEQSVNSSNAADIRWFRRDNANDVTAPYTGARIWHKEADITGPISVDLHGQVVFDEYTDVWAEAVRTQGSAAEVSVSLIGATYRK